MTADTLWSLAQVLLIPALAGLVLYVRQIDVRSRDRSEEGKAELASYKLHVAERYATNSYIQEVDKRMTDRLTSIDTKLDRLIERDHLS